MRGCGTTIDVAEKLGRDWIGIEVAQLAIFLIKNRLQDTCGSRLKFISSSTRTTQIMKPHIMTPNKLPPSRLIRMQTVIALAVAMFVACFCTKFELRAADSVSEKVGAVASDAEKQITEASKAAESKIQELWRRIDERRLKNRTPDQLVAWVIMGLLAGGLIHQFSKLRKVSTLLFGLVGAFIGGIVANVIQLDLGLGLVLIRYEDLVASLAGGLVIVLVARWLAARKSKGSANS